WIARGLEGLVDVGLGNDDEFARIGITSDAVAELLCRLDPEILIGALEGRDHDPWYRGRRSSLSGRACNRQSGKRSDCHDGAWTESTIGTQSQTPCTQCSSLQQVNICRYTNCHRRVRKKWARRDSIPRHPACKAGALTN